MLHLNQRRIIKNNHRTYAPRLKKGGATGSIPGGAASTGVMPELTGYDRPDEARRYLQKQIRLVSDDCTGEAYGCANRIIKTAGFFIKERSF